ncbi:hypothetical protein SDC9_184473 [bioreactor metagenome]|uniref:Uncharacterized protein n=1 Tax=bioreactor metagenome TaxID=1076179 RepID=A0A645HD58_9ZZZZ
MFAVQLQQGIAIGLGAACVLDGDKAAATGAVVHGHALFPALGQLFANDAQYGIGTAAHGKGRDHGHGAIGIAGGITLGQRLAGCGQHSGGGNYCFDSC